MEKLKFYIGTYSDRAIIKQLRETNSNLIYKGHVFSKYFRAKPEILTLSDAEIKTKVIDAGLINGGLVQFFALNIARARQMANELDLKNFSEVGSKLYEQDNFYL